jgi:hypothetical protein
VAARRLFAALLLAASAVTLAACGALDFGPSEDDRTPRGTVRRYFEASVSGDCRLASSLSTPEVVRQGLWCENPRVLSFGEISDGEQFENAKELYFMVDAVVIGGTSLEQLGLQAGENSILVLVVQDPDGAWRVSQANPRMAPPQPPQ